MVKQTLINRIRPFWIKFQFINLIFALHFYEHQGINKKYYDAFGWMAQNCAFYIFIKKITIFIQHKRIAVHVFLKVDLIETSQSVHVDVHLCRLYVDVQSSPSIEHVRLGYYYGWCCCSHWFHSLPLSASWIWCNSNFIAIFNITQFIHIIHSVCSESKGENESDSI